jgi:hypothetical protein
VIRRGHTDLTQETRDGLHPVASHAGRPLAIVGHQLANDLRAPLLI